MVSPPLSCVLWPESIRGEYSVVDLFCIVPAEYFCQSARLPSGFAACLTGLPAYSDRMKKLVAAITLLLTSLSLAPAQVTAEIVMSQEHFLLGETVPVAVRVMNRSGQKIKLGEDADWLTFTVEKRGGNVIAKLSDPPVQGEFTLESGQTGIRRVELTPHFSLDRNGLYRITANVRVKAWDSTITTKPKDFDIINGAKIWSQEFGMPLAAGVTNRAPEVRQYSLEQANYLRTKLRLYLRITDVDDSRVIKVLHVGPMVSISKPDPQIDRANNLHVLYQHTAHGYLYVVITPEGEIVLRQTHEIADGRPKLVGDENGRFRVLGGLRLPSENDIPSLKSIETDAAPQTP